MRSFAQPTTTAFSVPSFLRGARLALPIILGYLAVSFAFGVLADRAGLAPWQAALMGIFVFAGSGQLITVDLLLAGVAAPSIVVTNLIVNLRHLLMSAAVTPYLGAWPKSAQAAFCFELTDETFALHMSRFPKGVDAGEIFGINVASHAAWAGGGWIGAAMGASIGDTGAFGFDYALPAMFIALLLPHCAIPRRLLAAAIAGGIATLLTLHGLQDWSVIASTVIAASLVTAVIAMREQGAKP